MLVLLAATIAIIARPARQSDRLKQGYRCRSCSKILTERNLRPHRLVKPGQTVIPGITVLGPHHFNPAQSRSNRLDKPPPSAAAAVQALIEG